MTERTLPPHDVIDITAVDEPTEAKTRPPIPPLPPRRGHQRPKPTLLPFLTAGVFALALALCVWGTYTALLDDLPISGLLVIPVLATLVAVLARRAAREEKAFNLAAIMMIGFGLRCIGAFFRYRSPVDALVYQQEGNRIAASLRHLEFGVDTGREIPGTGWIRYATGVIHVFVFDDMYATLLVYTFLAFLGTYLCYRAFVRAVPDGDHKRYALLIFLWPSLVYWPSSIGKEAWMILGLGIFSWGVSRLVTGKTGIGILTMALGAAEMTLTRPHIALMCLFGFAVALLARPPKTASSIRIATRIAGVLVLVVGGSLLAFKTASFLKTDNVGTEGVNTAIEETLARTGQGGASFSPIVVRTPLEYPAAAVTVWFRPFPNEARGEFTNLLSAAENLLLLAIIIASWRRLRGLLRAAIHIPYVAYAMAYCVIFVYAFAAIANFGILARQRTQGLLLLFVLLCIPELAPRVRGHFRTAGLRDRLRLRGGQRGPEVADADDGEGVDTPAGDGRRRPSSVS